MKLESFSLFLDAFSSLDPRCHLDNKMSLYKYITYVKGVLGLGGGGGGGGESGVISERRHQISDKNRPLCKIVVFIVHQLYVHSVIGRLFTLV